jgi:hypothetical protein
MRVFPIARICALEIKKEMEIARLISISSNNRYLSYSSVDHHLVLVFDVSQLK